MGPDQDLPIEPSWPSPDSYITSLLTFITACTLFRNLCGGIHILDFLTRQPDLYTNVLPAEWRSWFSDAEIDDVLHLLLRMSMQEIQACASNEDCKCWASKELTCPPPSLLSYLITVRRHCLLRSYSGGNRTVPAMPRPIAVGMKPKKIHEVSEFAAYVAALAKDITPEGSDEPSIVDFGSGQNYLGRTLASPPYEQDVIAIERRHHNVDGARDKVSPLQGYLRASYP